MKKIKKTMIFQEDKIFIINGLARISRNQITEVLDLILELGINQLDDNLIEQSLILGKYFNNSKKKLYYK